MCSDNVGLMLVQAERVIWKQQTRRGKERDRLKLGGECGLALKSCKNASSDRMKERMREIEERNVIGRDKSWVSSPQAVCFFFFSQSNRRWWEEIHRQVTQAPQSSRDYWDRGTFERMTEVSHLNNASWHICQDVSPGKKFIEVESSGTKKEEGNEMRQRDTWLYVKEEFLDTRLNGSQNNFPGEIREHWVTEKHPGSGTTGWVWLTLNHRAPGSTLKEGGVQQRELRIITCSGLTGSVHLW